MGFKPFSHSSVHFNARKGKPNKKSLQIEAEEVCIQIQEKKGKLTKAESFLWSLCLLKSHSHRDMQKRDKKNMLVFC